MIYGYTGLRLGEQGLEPRFPPVLPSHIKRLTLKNVFSRGKRYDIVIDSTGRRMDSARVEAPAMMFGFCHVIC